MPFILRTPLSMVWYGVISGIGSGIFFAVGQALSLEVLPNPQTAAKDIGILNFANTGAQILAPILGATIYRVVGSQYLLILPILSIVAIIGGCLVLLIRE